jgi:hypothetical protein
MTGTIEDQGGNHPPPRAVREAFVEYPDMWILRVFEDGWGDLAPATGQGTIYRRRRDGSISSMQFTYAADWPEGQGAPSAVGYSKPTKGRRAGIVATFS